MSESFPPPPAYEEINKTSADQNFDHNCQLWYKKLIALNFYQEEAHEYAKLFVMNRMEFNMIPELDDNILKSIGIDKAGHRIRILRLQKNRVSKTSALVAGSVVNTLRCSWHPHVAAHEKCRKCNRLVCLQCRKEKTSDGAVRYYCQNCYDDCTIL